MRHAFRTAILLVLITAAARPAAAQIDLSGEWAGTFYKVLPVQGNIYLIAGAGANIVMQIGEDGVLLVDSGAKANAEKGSTA